MTQAYNLAILANAVDSSGKLNVGTNATGTLPVANGGTGSSSPSLVAGSGISISGSFPNQTITNTSSATGTVTSVATGNGLQGGTITTSGTLSVACPSFNSVGSYVWGILNASGGSVVATSGSTYSAGSGNRQLLSRTMNGTSSDGNNVNNLSGTWRWMAASWTVNDDVAGLACRVS
jgi:hypothetical protein